MYRLITSMCDKYEALEAQAPMRPPPVALTPGAKESGDGIAGLCVQIAELLQISPGMPADVENAIIALVRLSPAESDRDCLLEAVRIAARKGRRGRDGLGYAKGVLANKSGNRDLFFARFDEELLAIAHTRSPPARAES